LEFPGRNHIFASIFFIFKFSHSRIFTFIKMEIVHQITRLTAIDSTNEYAKKVVLPESDSFINVIVADEQSAGRGQRGNVWLSERKKNLTLSFCFSPSFLTLDNRFYLSKIMSAAVFEVLELIKSGFKIKWPNDIIFEKRKIGGILIENTISGNKISLSIIGLGLNVNQKKFPTELPNAVSLLMILGKEMNLQDLTDKIIESFKKYYLLLKTNRYMEIDRKYFSNLYQLNDWADYRDSESDFRGRIRGTNPDGRLLVQTESDEIKKYDFKEIVFL
jgi:BirA family biotin operon repressor/biotin-[acetyl-CoA-carboxylase] ligase